MAKNLGSSGSGLSHWWYQRFTAILLALLTGWLLYFFSALSLAESNMIAEIIRKPYNIIMLLLFTGGALYHGVLGMQVIIEDYVHCIALKLVLLLFVQIFAIITIVSFIVALLH